MTKRTPIILLFLIVLNACVPAATPPATERTVTSIPSEGAAEPSDWWREAVFYEIFVRSFYDTNENGIGDFNGITQKLDYLQELGITAIWLMPVHPSPSYHGYDVLDYYTVNPEYGSMADFERLLEEAHQRDMRIIIDLVINHTSDQNPFFIEANRDPETPYRDWYIWSETDLGNNWHPGNEGYYYSSFQSGMPDLNYANPEVTSFMQDVVRFWLEETGVDGFRVDAAKHLIEEGEQRENTRATHEWYRDFYQFYKAEFPEAYMVGEVFGAGSSVVESYTGDQLDQVFNFEMSSGFVNSARGEASSGLTSAIRFTQADMPDFNFAIFLTNHDQNRVMSVLGGDMEKAKIAAFLLLTSPGTPFIYYGEEIGMHGRKPDEDIRLPMQWTGEEYFGFSGSRPWRSPVARFPAINVEAQMNDPNSLLSYYRTLIHLRQANSALHGTGIQLLDTGHRGVYAALRYNGDQVLLVLTNLTGEPVETYALNLDNPVLETGVYDITLLLGEGNVIPLRIENRKISNYVPLKALPSYSTFVMHLKP